MAGPSIRSPHASTPLIVVGSHNRKKGKELAELLAPHGWQVATLADFPNPIDVVEDGDSFAANARLKAIQQARHLGQWVLADDSGIEVDALGGAPGIYSARFAGEPPDDEANNRLLLARLAGLPDEKRGAQYYCHVAVADPQGQIRAEATGICRGRIREEPDGENGFGYDPLFEIRELHQTFGRLGPHVKQVLSHRGRAMRSLLPRLLALQDEFCSPAT
jgi:XTP/dITP diphosphohydrolase